MKNLFFITFTLLILSMDAIAQQSFITNYNNVRARINANGCFFTEPSVNRASYEVPRTVDGSGADVIYNSAFWIGAKDQNDSIRVCANAFINSAKDFRTGPVANNYTDLSFINKYDRVYTVDKVEIEQHQLNWNDPNYSVPVDILNWPGNGDISNGEAPILAPFVDYNANNTYEPLLGDHPLIRGDQSSFFILNDQDGNHALSGGLNLGMEYHFMIYQYQTNNYQNDNTFINLKVINRSQETYNQLIVANYTDFDIGGPGDDYVGSSSNENMIFAYNADSIDNSNSSVTAFGANPPACGIKLLNHPIAVAGYYNNSGGVQSDPSVTADFWNYMTGHWSDGSSFTEGGNGYGGSTPTTFLYDGNPNDPLNWTELSESNMPGDRRAFMASEPIDNFAPNDYVCFDYAVLTTGYFGNHLQNVDGLFQVADLTQSFYDSQVNYYCQDVILSVNNTEQISGIELYPNPTSTHFMVQFDGEFNVEIYDISGKLIRSLMGISSSQNIIAPKDAGVYLVKIRQDKTVETLKLLVK